MFVIKDGREYFYQWDLNQQLLVLDNTINEVHFCNKTDSCSLVCNVKEENGQRVVDVPNIILQSSWDFRAYAYCTDHTIRERKFKVLARSKPSDYVYTETEVKSYEAFENRIAALEEKQNDYLTEIPSEYVTETELAEKGYLTEHQSLTDYAKKSDIPKKVSQLTNDKGYQTSVDVNSAIGAAIAELPKGVTVINGDWELGEMTSLASSCGLEIKDGYLVCWADPWEIYANGVYYGAFWSEESFDLSTLDKSLTYEICNPAAGSEKEATLSYFNGGDTVNMLDYYTKEETENAIDNRTKAYYTKEETENAIDNRAKAYYTKEETEALIIKLIEQYSDNDDSGSWTLTDNTDSELYIQDNYLMHIGYIDYWILDNGDKVGALEDDGTDTYIFDLSTLDTSKTYEVYFAHPDYAITIATLVYMV